MKIVINKEHGGFGLSEKAVLLYGKKKGLNITAKQDEMFKTITHYYLNEVKVFGWEIERDDPVLVEVVEELGDLANARYSKLKIIEVPDDVKWYIHDDSGVEEVHEQHRKWS